MADPVVEQLEAERTRLLQQITEYERVLAMPEAEDEAKAEIKDKKLPPLTKALAEVERELEDERACLPLTEVELTYAPKNLDWLWDPFIAAKKTTIFAAGGGSGKTSLEVGLALHRAVGKPFLGFKVTQGHTVIITAEDDREDFLRKIWAWKERAAFVGKRNLFPMEAIQKYVTIYDRSGKDSELAQVDHGQYFVSDYAHKLTEKLRRRFPTADLYIFDTASRFGSGDESNGAMSALVRACEMISRVTGAAVLLSAHISKQAARESIKDAYIGRGGSALSDNARSVVALTKIDKARAEAVFGGEPDPEDLHKILELQSVKGNFKPPAQPVLLERVSTVYDGGLVLELIDREYGMRRSIEKRKEKLADKFRDYMRTLEGKDLRISENYLKEHASQVQQATGFKTKKEIGDALNAACELGYVTVQKDKKGMYYELATEVIPQWMREEQAKGPLVVETFKDTI